MKDTLDVNDLIILYTLKNNGRISLTDLGKKIDLTPAAVTYRLNKLISNKVITNFTTTLNYDVLTPNYSSYIISINSKLKDTSIIVNKLIETNYFEKLFEIASELNIQGITNALSNKQFKKLCGLLKDELIISFSTTPILSDLSKPSKHLIGENIESVYCPLCQKAITGQGIITELNDKIFSFCCTECQIEFQEDYLEIIKMAT